MNSSTCMNSCTCMYSSTCRYSTADRDNKCYDKEICISIIDDVLFIYLFFNTCVIHCYYVYIHMKLCLPIIRSYI